jgi:hypothetical protein
MNTPQEPRQHGLDILGLKPISEAVNTVTKGGVEGAAAFLGRICLPAAEEFGLLLQDRVRAWRARNAACVAQKAEHILATSVAETSVHAHPRLVGVVLEQGSWMDASEVQDLWAGLLASSCSESGRDDSNLMFADILARLSVSQVHVLEYVCSQCKKSLSEGGLPVSDVLSIPLSDLQSIAGVTDLHRLDRELDHLRSLELTTPHSGFSLTSTESVEVTPTTLALQMFARCKGHRGDPGIFFGLSRSDLSASTAETT